MNKIIWSWFFCIINISTIIKTNCDNDQDWIIVINYDQIELNIIGEYFNNYEENWLTTNSRLFINLFLRNLNNSVVNKII
jgi:hypothetical protein